MGSFFSIKSSFAYFVCPLLNFYRISICVLNQGPRSGKIIHIQVYY
jgi:hypothetical protein